MAMTMRRAEPERAAIESATAAALNVSIAPTNTAPSAPTDATMFVREDWSKITWSLNEVTRTCSVTSDARRSSGTPEA